MALLVRRRKLVLNYLEDKPTVFKAQVLNFPAVTFKQLVSECSRSCGVNSSTTKAVLEAVVDRMCHYIEIGHPVKMGDFGSFKPYFTAKTAKKIDEATAETIQRRKVRFYPGAELRNTIADLNISEGSAIYDAEE